MLTRSSTRQRTLQSGFDRFSPENLVANKPVVDLLRRFAEESMDAKLNLPWHGSSRRSHRIIPIPGTRNLDHLNENLGAIHVQLTPADIHELETDFSKIKVHGGRMNEEQMKVVDQTMSHRSSHDATTSSPNHALEMEDGARKPGQTRIKQFSRLCWAASGPNNACRRRLTAAPERCAHFVRSLVRQRASRRRRPAASHLPRRPSSLRLAVPRAGERRIRLLQPHRVATQDEERYSAFPLYVLPFPRMVLGECLPVLCLISAFISHDWNRL